VLKHAPISLPFSFVEAFPLFFNFFFSPMKMSPNIILCLNTGRYKVFRHYLQNYGVHFATYVWCGKYSILQWEMNTQASIRTVLIIMPFWPVSPGIKIWCMKQCSVHCCVVSPGDGIVRLQDIVVVLSECCVWGWIACRDEERFQSVLHSWPLWKWKFCSVHIQLNYDFSLRQRV